MASVNPSTTFNGYEILAAHRLTSNLILSPAIGKATYEACFPKKDPKGTKYMLSSTLTRTLTWGGQESSSIPVDQISMGDIDVPIGVFTGRKVTWSVADDQTDPAYTILTISVESLDTTGTQETWCHDLIVNRPLRDTIGADVCALTPTTLISGVTVC